MGFSTLANIAFLQSSLVLNLFCFPKHHNRTLTILSETLVCLTKIIFAQLNLNINHKYLITLIYLIQNRIKYKLILPYAVHFYCSFIHYNLLFSEVKTVCTIKDIKQFFELFVIHTNSHIPKTCTYLRTNL